MKKAILGLLAIIFLAAFSNNATAQVKIGKVFIQDEALIPPSSIEDLPIVEPGNGAVMINEKAMRHFQKNYKNAVAVSWSKTEDNGYIANFKTEFGQVYVAYDIKGNWHHSIEYFNEKHLPLDIRKAVKFTYFDYNIVKAAQVNIGLETIYVIYAQGEDNFKILKYAEGEIYEITTTTTKS